MTEARNPWAFSQPLGQASEYLRATRRPPLTTFTNVVTSRAVLITTGTIYPKKNQGQWGCLYNT
jgi:hypothetical protein